MAQPHVLCACRLAKHAVDVHRAAGQFVAYTCEHCDQPCNERRCQLCARLRSNANANA